MRIEVMSIRRILILLVLAAVVGLSGACDDDDGVPSIRPTMADIWPHADGSTWTYEMSFRMYEDALLAEVGDLPTLEELRRDLETPLKGTPDTTLTSLYTLAFEGMTTTSTGVQAQNLAEYVEDVRGTGRSTPSVPGGPSRLLRALAASGSGTKAAPALDGFEPIGGPPTPLFLRGGAFAYEDTGYYGYGGGHTDHAWIYLEGDLSEGSSFSLQVAPGVVDGIRLFGQVRNAGTERIGRVFYRNVLECMYVYDLGEISVLDESGTVLGTTHSFIYGWILFAPGIGPVASRERSRVVMRTAYNPEGPSPTTYWVNEFECQLVVKQLPGN